MRGRSFAIDGSLCQAAVFALVSAFTAGVSAADTIETFEVGATDVEFYTGADGLGLPSDERAAFGDMMLGYGLVERLSAYFGTTLEGSGAFTDGCSTHYLGLFGTPLDTNHLDLDLQFDLASGGPEQRLEIRPALELNFDADPEIRTWGMYLRTPLPVYGRKFQTGREHATFHLEATLGAHVHVAEGNQLLVEYDMAFNPDPQEAERRTDVGGAAFGYNVVVSDEIELINQVFVDIPQAGDRVSVSLMTGLIATLPSAAGAQP
jgi:hypothetical protein